MKRFASALALVFLAFIALPASADVTLLNAATATTVTSPSVRSSHMGAAGGLDAYTFTLSAFARRAQLQQSNDGGTHWATVALFLGAPIVRTDCGGCRFRIYVAGNPDATPLTATVAATGDLVLVTP